MLPDFLLRIPGFGADVALVARDVPACVFFAGFPDALDELFEPSGAELTPGMSARLERWAEGLLTRVVVRPRLTLEHVGRLGEARRDAVLGYLLAVGPGAAPAPALEPFAEPDLLPDVHDPEPARVGAIPEPSVQDALIAMSQRAHVLPSVLWLLPISEWLFDWRLLDGPRDRRTSTPRRRATTYTNDPRLLAQVTR